MVLTILFLPYSSTPIAKRCCSMGGSITWNMVPMRRELPPSLSMTRRCGSCGRGLADISCRPGLPRGLPNRRQRSHFMTAIITTIFAVLLAGSLVYCVLIMVASRRYLSITPPAPGACPPISVLKPLCGQDEGLEENLRSFLDQDYPLFEILLAVHRADDPAVEIVEKLKSEFSGRAEVRIVGTGESPVPNAKAHSLNQLVRHPGHHLLTLSYTDRPLPPVFLTRMAGEFHDPSVGLITCPYRAVGGRSVWSRLEGLGIDTEP